MKKLVLIGVGHAHMMLATNISRLISQGIQVSAVGPDPFHYYSGMGPGMLAGIYSPDDIRFPVKDMVEQAGGRFHLDRALRIDPHKRIVHLASGGEIAYDALSCNAGSTVPTDPAQNPDMPVFSVKPIANLLHLRRHVLDHAAGTIRDIAVVGGGPAGLETAGGLWRLCREAGSSGTRITVFAGRRFLSDHPGRVRTLARRSFAQRSIRINEQGYVKDIRSGRIELENGTGAGADVVLLALGIKPSALFKDSGLPTGPGGGLAVNRFLQCTKHPEIFGGGDCIHFEDHPLDKVGVHAVRENPVLLNNLTAFLTDKPLQTFEPDPDYLLIFNLGDGTGIFWKKRLIFNGRLAFWIKDWIDRRFMRRFEP